MGTAILIAVLVLGGSILIGIPLVTGLVIIGEKEVGIVIKKFSRHDLAPGHLIALKGESGYQADTLPPGWHLWYFFWQYTVKKVGVTIIPQGEIGLVVANDGRPIPEERILGKIVPCDNFQDARKFLLAGGEKGRQLGFLTAGTYRLNSALFTVISSINCTVHGMSPDDLKLYRVQPDKVGIVTTLDGAPISAGEIAGAVIPGHDNFQKAQEFMNAGGRRGLQEQVLLSGSWNLNPWFVQVEQAPMTEIPIGHVGIVISYVGLASEDVSGLAFKHGDLVKPGHKGVWVTPLYPGKHPVNSRVMKIELVPTTNIVLNWADRTEAHSYDEGLNSIIVRSKDGFSFKLDVAQIIHVGATDAPKVISRVGSMQNLVDHVLQPIVGNYFRNAAQAYTVLDFLSARSERQTAAAEHIRAAINEYDVQAIDTLIGNITPPPELMQTLTDRKIAEEQQKTYQVQQEAQQQRQVLVRETALAEIQHEMVKADQGVKIAELEAKAAIQKASGEAEAVRRMGAAKADAYKLGAEAMGQQGFTAVQLMQIIGDRHIRIIPDIMVNGGGNGNGSTVSDALIAMLVRQNLPTAMPITQGNGKPAEQPSAPDFLPEA